MCLHMSNSDVQERGQAALRNLAANADIQVITG
jgi:hypothetical protein